MKTRYYSLWAAAILLLFSFTQQALAQNRLLPVLPPIVDHYQDFVITSGKVTITPVFCAPAYCQVQYGEFKGTFQAAIANDQIKLQNIALKSTVDFILPEDPHTDVYGAVYDATVYFDGQTLVLEGVVNSSAFDGPIVEYALTAEVVTNPGLIKPDHFLVRQDYRKCSAPLCGGVFIRALNGAPLKCPASLSSSKADSLISKECYIGTVDWSALGFNAFRYQPVNTELLLAAKIDYSMHLGRLHVGEAWLAQGRRTAGTFYSVTNNGLMCITTPCFSYDQVELNANAQAKKFSSLELERSGAPSYAIEEAYQRLANGQRVIVAGNNQTYKGFAGQGIRLVANQFYLPVKPPRLPPIIIDPIIIDPVPLPEPKPYPFDPAQ